MHRTIAAAGVAALLLGCALPPPDNAPRFVAAEQAPPGLARLYVFRPADAEPRQRDVPTLSLNGKPAVRLVHAAYSQLSLTPGRYTATVTPGSFETGAWSATRPLVLEPGKVYYLAISMDMSIERGTTFFAVPGTVVPTIPLPNATAHARGTRFEIVPASQVGPLIAGLRYLAPENTHFAPER